MVGGSAAFDGFRFGCGFEVVRRHCSRFVFRLRFCFRFGFGWGAQSQFVVVRR
jgi:hypothetical protein